MKFVSCYRIRNYTDSFYYDGSSNDGFYYYKRNLQGDIIGILNSSSTEVVTYLYNAWGKLVSNTGTLASTVGADNPFRYRGYYYDTETSLYYLNQRYYNPEWGRFINADAIIGAQGDLGGHNLFSYCQNNPTMYSDPSGNRPESRFHNKKIIEDEIDPANTITSSDIVQEVITGIIGDALPSFFSEGLLATSAISFLLKKALLAKLFCRDMVNYNAYQIQDRLGISGISGDNERSLPTLENSNVSEYTVDKLQSAYTVTYENLTGRMDGKNEMISDIYNTSGHPNIWGRKWNELTKGEQNSVMKWCSSTSMSGIAKYILAY